MNHRLERLEADLNLAKLEAEFAHRKLNGGATKGDRETLRTAREAYRLNYRIPRDEGASPGAIGARLEAKTLWQKIMDVMTGEI